LIAEAGKIDDPVKIGGKPTRMTLKDLSVEAVRKDDPGRTDERPPSWYTQDLSGEAVKKEGLGKIEDKIKILILMNLNAELEKSDARVKTGEKHLHNWIRIGNKPLSLLNYGRIKKGQKYPVPPLLRISVYRKSQEFQRLSPASASPTHSP
jgi:hypothetical protein